MGPGRWRQRHPRKGCASPSPLPTPAIYFATLLCNHPCTPPPGRDCHCAHRLGHGGEARHGAGGDAGRPAHAQGDQRAREGGGRPAGGARLEGGGWRGGWEGVDTSPNQTGHNGGGCGVVVVVVVRLGCGWGAAGGGSWGGGEQEGSHPEGCHKACQLGGFLGEGHAAGHHHSRLSVFVQTCGPLSCQQLYDR